MSVHYKFKNTTSYDAVKFDGVLITVSDLKSNIAQRSKISNCDLQLENEETRQIYTDDQMIPKNTNVIVSRIPFAGPNKKARLQASQPYPQRFSANANSGGTTNNHHHHHNTRHGSLAASSHMSGALKNGDSANHNREAMELVSNKPMSEEERLKCIQSQSTKDFDPSRYARGRGGGANRGGRPGVPGHNYVCKKCGISGHFIQNCKGPQMVKRSSGIPKDHLDKADAKDKGAYMTPSGEYVIPKIDKEAYSNPKIEKAPFFEDGTPSDSAQL